MNIIESITTMGKKPNYFVTYTVKCNMYRIKPNAILKMYITFKNKNKKKKMFS